MSAPAMTALSVALVRAARRLEGRLQAIEDRLCDGEDATWELYLTTLKLALDIERRLAPGGQGELITTAELARRLAVSEKTILRRKASGQLKPALVAGKRIIRWKAEAAR